MKRLLKLFSIVLVVLILTGCVKKNIHMDITNTEVNISVTDAMDSSLRDESEVEELKAKYKNLGYKVEDYDGKDDSLIGFVYSKTYKLSDVSSKDAVEFHLETIENEDFKNPTIFKVEEGIFGNTYRATFIFDTSEASLSGFDEDEAYENASSIDVSYTVTLPSKAKSHNADSVDGKTYTWNVTYGDKEEINFVFTTMSTLSFILCGVATIAIIAVIFVLVLKAVSKSKNNVPPASGIPVVAPVEPGVPMNNGANYIMPNVQPSPVEPSTSVEPETSNDTNQHM